MSPQFLKIKTFIASHSPEEVKVIITGDWRGFIQFGAKSRRDCERLRKILRILQSKKTSTLPRLIGKYKNPETGASQKVWDLGLGRYVLTSAVFVLFSGPETYVFECDEKGEVTNLIELPGSFRGEFDHEKALHDYMQTIKS